jgi:hypothetical protein
MRPQRAVAGLGFAVALIFALLPSTSVRAQDQHLAKTVKAGHAASISGYARSNGECEGVEPPGLYVDTPPQHGIVCFRTSKIMLREAIVGNLTYCVGRKIGGVTVVYLPRWKYVGADTTRYSVVFPEARRNIDVDLTVVPDRPDSPDQVPADINGPAVESSQSPGPMPRCTALVS